MWRRLGSLSAVTMTVTMTTALTRPVRRRPAWIVAAAMTVALVALVAIPARAQRGAAAGQPPATPRSSAAIDLTGTWTSVVSEDWPQRMLPARKGNYTRLPLTPAARKVADAWDPAKDETAGEACRAYGAPAIMRLPGRIRLSWQDDRALKMELEAGTQTRLFLFGQASAQAQAPASSPPPAPSWQGRSSAEWVYTAVPPRTGELKVATTGLRPGYLRKNGVPYSADTRMTEYFHRMTAPNGDLWLTVVTEVVDPENLRDPFVQSTHFKKLAASAAFTPEACEVR